MAKQLELLQLTVDLSGEHDTIETIDRIASALTRGGQLTLPQERVPSSQCEVHAVVDGQWKRLPYLPSTRSDRSPSGGVQIEVPPGSTHLRVRTSLEGHVHDSGNGVRLWEPTTVLQFPTAAGHWPTQIRVVLDHRLRAEAIGVVARTRLHKSLPGLESLLDGLAIRSNKATQSTQSVSQMLRAQLDQIAGRVDEIERELRVLEGGKTNFADGHDPKAVAVSLQRIRASIGALSNPSLSVADLARRLTTLKTELTRIPELRWLSTRHDIKLPDTKEFELGTLRIPVSPASRAANRIDGRLGTPLAFMILATALAALAWRINGPWLIDSISTARAAKNISDSRESILAFLLFFPAIIITQIDRPHSSRLPAKIALAALSAALNLSLLVPMFTSILVIGEPRPVALTVSLLIGAGLLIAAAAAVWRFHSDKLVGKSHRRVALLGST